MTNEDQLAKVGTRPELLTAKRMILIEVLVFSIAMTILQFGFLRNSYITALTTVLTSIGYGIALLAWCKADSREREYSLSEKFPYAVVILGSFAMVYYLFRSRGFIKGIAGVGSFVLFVVGMYIVSAVFGIFTLIAISPFYNPLAQPSPPAYKRNVPLPPAAPK